MLDKPNATAGKEWARYWFLPFVAALGFSASGLHLYGMGLFVEPIEREFGWSRAQIMAGPSLVSIGVLLGSMPMGVLIDRLGPRRIALIGVLLIGASVAMLSTFTGTLLNWIVLWTIIAICSNWVQSTVWTSVVVARFEHSRGLALGITLSGSSFVVFALPLLCAWLLGAFGWRSAFVWLGGIWAVVLFPVIFFFFRGPYDDGAGARMRLTASSKTLPGLTLPEALRTATLYKLLFATAFFVAGLFGIVVHMVPLLTNHGATPMMAATVASLVGVFSLIGRLSTGLLLDRFPAQIVGAISFLLPIPACALLMMGGVDTSVYFIAAALIGLTVGSETDVVVYLASRHFGMKNFGAIQGMLVSAIALGGATGPPASGAVFDHFGHYDPFLACVIVLMLISASLMASIARKPTWQQYRSTAAVD